MFSIGLENKLPNDISKNQNPYLQYLTNTISSFVTTVGNKVRYEFTVGFFIFKNNCQVQTRIWLKYNLSELKILLFWDVFHARDPRTRPFGRIDFQRSFSFKSMVTKYFRTSLIEIIPSAKLHSVSDWSHDFVIDSIRFINGGIVINIWTWVADGHFSNSTRHFSRYKSIFYLRSNKVTFSVLWELLFTRINFM